MYTTSTVYDAKNKLCHLDQCFMKFTIQLLEAAENILQGYITTSILHSRTVKLCALSTILASIGSYFSAVDLAEFAHVLDEAEKARMAEGDITPSGLNRLMQVDTCLIPRLDSEPD